MDAQPWRESGPWLSRSSASLCTARCVYRIFCRGCNLPDDVASCILFAPACIGADYVLSIGEGHLLHHRKARRLGAGDFAKSESLSQGPPNLLKRQFDVVDPNKVWVTDIIYIRTYEGWLYLAMVLDLFYRQVVGWSMKPQMTRDLAIDALLMAVWSADF